MPGPSPDGGLPTPRYTIWQAVGVALSLAQRALEEVRTFIKDGGKPGPAGLGFEDMKVIQNGRYVTLRWERGDQVYEHTLFFPFVIYRGVFEQGQDYEQGDMVTFAGCCWHCNEPTRDRPKSNVTAWTLAVKAGRDGKDGAKGDQGPPGRDGGRR